MEININQAIRAHQEGRLIEAENLYLEILRIQPNNLSANNNLGVLLYTLGRLNEAVTSYKKTIEFKPNYTEAHKNLGIALQDLGRLDEAEASYRKTIELKPDHVLAHFNLGVLLQELGRSNEAEKYYKKVIEIKPDYVEAYNNLGVLLYTLGRLNEAVTSYKKTIEFKPNYTEARYNLANTLKNLGRLDEAEASYRKTIELKPDHVLAHFNLGVLLQELGRSNEAEKYYKKVIEIKPDYVEAYNNLGTILRSLNRLNEAVTSYKKAIELKPDCDEAKHLLAALTGQTTNAPPRKYIEDLFDNYAINFEDSLLNKLEYNIPKKITEIIVEKNSNSMLGSILDLGCGTGLIGEKINKYCSNLEGIDLSKSMLKIARSKNIYDKLKHVDIVEYLSTEDLDFNYFISTDVFIYVGALSEIFRLIKSRNKSGGKFVFSTEHTERDGFFLEQSGRYSHSKKYIESLCEKFHYKLSHFETAKLRKSKNKFIIGGLYTLDF